MGEFWKKYDIQVHLVTMKRFKEHLSEFKEKIAGEYIFYSFENYQK